MAQYISSVNHIGFVVNDLDEGVRFFVDVLGFAAIEGRKGDLPSVDDIQRRRFGIDPTAVGRYAFVELSGSVIELLEWTAPDRNGDAPLSSDAGGRHLALNVPDMDATVAHLSAQPGVEVREPNDMGYRYVKTPLGLEIQLIPAPFA